jgi:chromosome partitioning protein
VFPRRGPRIIAVANQKGGVGKTTTAINLGTALAAVRKQVVILDLDPQGNASTGLGVERAARTPNSYHLLIGEAGLGDVVQETLVPGLSVVPSGVDLSGAEIELAGMENRQFYLKDALARDTEAYDYVLIDCPPALGLLTVNALVAAQAAGAAAMRILCARRNQLAAQHRGTDQASVQSWAPYTRYCVDNVR